MTIFAGKAPRQFFVSFGAFVQSGVVLENVEKRLIFVLRGVPKRHVPDSGIDLRKSHCYNVATRNGIKTAGIREVAQLG